MSAEIDLIALAQPQIREAKRILRTCVHCGFCLATCPTYILLGDERDSPRGRIQIIKHMLAHGGEPTVEAVRHVDRCLSCLSCTTTCPSGVDYQHLVDHARVHIALTHKRPLQERLLRMLLTQTLPFPWRLRTSLHVARILKPLRALFPSRLRTMFAIAPKRIPGPSWADRPDSYRSATSPHGRIVLLGGCAQKVLAPQINEATIRVLTRLGCEVLVPRADCCGALAHHLGDSRSGSDSARSFLQALSDLGDFDAVVSTASGCGTHLKDYASALRDDPQWGDLARRVARVARDISEVLLEIMPDPPVGATLPVVASHGPCSLQHGQKLHTESAVVLRRAGFTVRDIPENHICCGSAGTYNLLQPELADRLRKRKCRHIDTIDADVVAAGNIGCIVQISSGTEKPVVHPIELIDWSLGGPVPSALRQQEP